MGLVDTGEAGAQCITNEPTGSVGQWLSNIVVRPLVRVKYVQFRHIRLVLSKPNALLKVWGKTCLRIQRVMLDKHGEKFANAIRLVKAGESKSDIQGVVGFDE